MRRHGFLIVTALSLMLAATCAVHEYEDGDDDGNENENQTGKFTTVQELSLSKSADQKTVTARWTPSDPAPDSYDLYYKAEDTASVSAVKAGTRVSGAKTGAKVTVSYPGTYSFVVTAKKSGYPSTDSEIKTITLEFEPPERVPAGSKRGVSYNFTDQPGGASTAAAAMDLFESLSWFYNWGTEPNSTVASAAAERGIAYFPMAWNADAGAHAKIRAYVAAHPECEYLLAYNEPNLTDQANMTPAQAASAWPALVALAEELHLKIVAPAMNYGTLSGYGDPITWLDEFFSKSGVSIDDVDAIAIHCYMAYPGAVKGYIDKFKKYNKPIWMTEFCAWDQSGYEVMHNAADQMKFMSEVVTYMELDPAVERYAWFIPLYGNTGTEKPYMQLLTKTNPPQLTALGKAYAKMGCCDKSVYVLAGEKIEAERFTDCNLSEWVNLDWSKNDAYAGGPQNSFYQGSVHYRPTTDSEDSTDGLDIFDFNNSKTSQWVEYQVETAEAKTCALLLRYQAAAAGEIQITVDGGAAIPAALNSLSWTTQEVSLGNIAAGQHKMRLKIISGNLALNWLKME